MSETVVTFLVGWIAGAVTALILKRLERDKRRKRLKSVFWSMKARKEFPREGVIEFKEHLPRAPWHGGGLTPKDETRTARRERDPAEGGWR